MAATLTSPPAEPAVRTRAPRRLPRVRREQAPAPRPTGVTAGAALGWSLVLLTSLVLGFGAYLVGGSALVQHRTQDVLYQQLRADLKAATVPVSAPFTAGQPLGLVTIPDLGLEQVFVAGSTSTQTAQGPGLKPDSVLPGQAGLSVLVGRRATLGSPFAHIGDLHPGSRIEVTTGQGKFTYVVDLVRTSDAPATQIRAVASRLTLVTSDPAFTPDRQLVVSARLATGQTALAASSGQAASPSDAPGQGSHDHGVALLLWSQLLLGVVVLVAWAATRLPRPALWIGAAPVLLALLWHVYAALALLLPNTL